MAGIASLRRVRPLGAYLLYSIGIWAGYYLHFYLAFFAFPATASVDPAAALLAFCIGSFAVLVPTPNGAGPWHFAVKTVLVLYGLAEAPRGGLCSSRTHHSDRPRRAHRSMGLG